MKKLLYILVIAVLFLTLLTVGAFADDEAEEIHGFEIIHADGSAGAYGDDQDALQASLGGLLDGDTLLFNKKFEISRKIFITSTEDKPKTVNIDLNGNILFSLKKITVFSSGDHTTLNIYSSKPGGVIYVTDASQGGNIFNIMGDSAVINAGTVTAGDTTYPGANLKTFSSCLVDLYPESDFNKLCDENASFNLTGGSHYSIHTDYSGFIIPRCGEATFNIKDANIIMLEKRAPINAAGENTVLNFENCRILQFESNEVALFNNAFGDITFKDCILTYRLSAATLTRGIVKLEGRNVFARSNESQPSLIAGGADFVGVMTSAEYELNDGVTELEYFDYTGAFIPLNDPKPTLTAPCIFISPEDAVEYRFVKGNDKTTQTWSKYEKPVFPYSLSTKELEGVYKNGWKRSVGEDGVITYEAGLVADFNIKVSAVYEDGSLFFNIFAPIYLMDEGYLDLVNVEISGERYPIRDWTEREVGGVRYAVAVTGEIEDADEVITVRLPFDYIPDKAYVDSTWSFTLRDYVDTVLSNGAEAYDPAEYAIVKSIKEDFFAE